MDSKLKKLENKSIEIIKNAYYFLNKEKIGMLYSMGKDSSVLLHLIKKAKVPLPIIIHIDTGKKIKTMIDYRNKILSANNLNNIIAENTTTDISNDKILCCTLRKTIPLNSVIYNEKNKNIVFSTIKDNNKLHINYDNKIETLFVAIRRDEEKSRCKEEYVSKRYKGKWNIDDTRLQINNFYSFDIDNESHLRIHPLLDWTELDIWEYIKQENIDIIDLYFSKNGYRYRSLGCECCTKKIKSNAVSIDDIICELKYNLHNVDERSVRLQDNKNGLEELRINGYM